MSTTIKDHVHEKIDALPDDSSYEEILRELYFDRMIRRGLEDADAGRVVSDEDVQRKIAKWSK